ncbi:unnamed protein product [Gordionus sp. m RMFG-2023]
MDPALIKEREKFKKRALANAIVKNKQEQSSNKKSLIASTNLTTSSTSIKSRYEPPINENDLSITSLSHNNLGAATYTSHHKFNVLTKVVKHLRERFLKGYSDHLLLEEILDEMKLLDVNNKIKLWLENEALPNNPKVKMSSIKSSDGSSKFMFKAPLDIRDKRSLLKLLAYRDEHGLGALTMEEVEESLPNALKIVKVFSAFL